MKKWNGIALLVLAGAITAGCSLQGKADTKETVVINEDVQLESSLADSHLNVKRENDLEVDVEADFRGFRGSKLYYNKDGGFYSFDALTETEEKLADQEVLAISSSAMSSLVYEGDNMYIYDLQAGELKSVAKGSPEDTMFVYQSGDDVAQYNWESNMVELRRDGEDETVSWDLNVLDDVQLSTFTKHEGRLLVAGSSQKIGLGIYELEDGGKVKPMIHFPGKGSIEAFDMLPDGSVIFNGNHEGKSGVFLLDATSNKVRQLVAGGKDQEGEWTPFYKVSPDGTKVMFDTPVQVEGEFKTNVYMAEIIDGQLSNSVRIMENADLYAVISHVGHWSEDSKTAYIALPKENSEWISGIAVFSVK